MAGETKYYYIGDQLTYEKRGDEIELYYFYDSFGDISGIRYIKSGVSQDYIFLTNWRGDAETIYDGTGTLQARYTYDAWGNVTSITDENGNAITDETHIANVNPIRYRGYYQDAETGFYYLLSRYYDPVTHRFINADGIVQTTVSEINLFSYCANNPVTYADSSGKKAYYIGISLAATLGFGVSGSLMLAIDDNKKVKLFYSYNTVHLGVYASASVNLGCVWDAETVDDLEGESIQFGVSGGGEVSFGIDMISPPDVYADDFDGIQFSLGYGVGFDAHASKTKTKAVKNPFKKKTSLKPKKPVKKKTMYKSKSKPKISPLVLKKKAPQVTFLGTVGGSQNYTYHI